MGIITGVLFTGGFLKTFDVPTWVILSAHAAIALGTLSGGWRIVHTMGGRLTRLKPRSGFCAETAAAMSILLRHRAAPAGFDHARDRRLDRRGGQHPPLEGGALGHRDRTSCGRGC